VWPFIDPSGPERLHGALWVHAASLSFPSLMFMFSLCRCCLSLSSQACDDAAAVVVSAGTEARGLPLPTCQHSHRRRHDETRTLDAACRLAALALPERGGRRARTRRRLVGGGGGGGGSAAATTPGHW
jgi:hypothetical protein